MPRESDIDSSIGEKAAGSGRSVLMELEVRRSPGEDIAFQPKKKHGELEPSFELLILNQGLAAALQGRCQMPMHHLGRQGG